MIGMRRVSVWLAALALLAGCAAPQPQLSLPQPLVLPGRSGAASVPEKPGASAVPSLPRVTPMPAPPEQTPRAATQPRVPTGDAQDDPADVSVNVDQVPLPSLIQLVYTEILGRSVSIDQKVLERRDLVTFRTPPNQTRAQLSNAMAILLKSYGLAAIDAGGVVRVVLDTPQTGFLPEIRRGAALPETPPGLRPIFQLVELQAVRNTDVAGWLKNIFQNRVTVQEDAGRNAIILSGQSDNVAAALEAIRVLDQPAMAGRASVRITPTFWAAEELAKRLAEILAAEGYAMPPPNYTPTSGGVRYPILLLPLAAQNAVLVFARSDDVLRHVLAWAEKLDQPTERGGGKAFFSYTAQNLSAEDLAFTLAQLLDGSASAVAAAPTAEGTAGNNTAGTSATRTSAARVLGGKVVVDKATNTLILRVSAEEYSQLVSLLRLLDKPAKAALIEVTVAELALSDDTQFGIEWLLKNMSSSGAGTVAGTLGGLNLGNSGFTLRRLVSGGDVRLILNALATSNRANILSSPRVMARNGETATIQVGQEVPVITSQQSSISAANPSATGVLQTVQYRNTGVILKVKPVIHSGERIDLEVFQEVSAAQSTVTGVNNSPTISTRKLETRMTLQSGTTLLLGGLISSTDSAGNAGLPVLKDIPVLGGLFGTQSTKNSKTELLVLITPYVIHDDEDARAVTEAFKSGFSWLGKGEEPNRAPQQAQ